MTPSIVTAEFKHIPAIAANVRQADKEEIWATACIEPAQALIRSLSVSQMAWTGMIDDQPVCMFGVVPVSLLGEIGRPWMIGTTMLDEPLISIIFLRRCKKCVREMLKPFRLLENYVSADNATAIEWLKWLGFRIWDAQKMGPYRMPFMRFTMGER
jgi:hypothetical protein